MCQRVYPFPFSEHVMLGESFIVQLWSESYQISQAAGMDVISLSQKTLLQIRTASEHCSACVSRVGLSTK